MATVRTKADTRPNSADVNASQVARPTKIDVSEIESPTVREVDLSALMGRRRGGSGGNAGTSSTSRSREISEPSVDNEEAERLRLEQERKRNESLRKASEAKRAQEEYKKQQDRKKKSSKDATSTNFGTMALPEASTPSQVMELQVDENNKVSNLEEELDRANGLISEPRSFSTAREARFEESDGIPTSTVLDNEFFTDDDEDLYTLNGLLGELDKKGKWANAKDTYTANNIKARHVPANDVDIDSLLELYIHDPNRIPDGNIKKYLSGVYRKRQRDMYDRRDKEIEDRRLADVIKRQNEWQEERKSINDEYDRLMGAVGKSRYLTIPEIREAAKDFIESNPGLHDYEFAGDRAFLPEWYKEDLSDEDIRKEITKAAGATWSDVNREIDTRRQSPETSIDAVRHGGAADYDPNSTVSENIRKFNQAIDGNARLIANPFLIKWGSERIEHVRNFAGSTYAKFRFSNIEGRDVEGAIGSVMRYYNCSTTSVMRLVIRQLGLGVDTNGKICGVPVEEFRLPDVLIIEACNDIIAIADRTGGIPTGLNVMGKSYGFDNSRDDTGMFPILGGTRCMPFGHIPLETFEDISGPGSPLYKMSANAFYLRNVELFVNDVQPHMMANAVGSRAYQAIAWNIANEGVLSIDGLPNDMYNIPEHQVYRTKAVLEADLMDTSDEQCLEAKQQRNKNMAEIDSRMRRMFFKDGGSRSNSNNEENGNTYIQAGELLGPGEESRNGPLDNVMKTFVGAASFARITSIGLALSAIPENLVGVATQGATISLQKIGKKYGKSAYHLNENFDRTEFLDKAITSDDALEAIEVFQTLMRVGGRTAVQEFFIDRNDGKTDRRYKAATRANLYDFLQRWKVSQTPEMVQKIENAISFLMIGQGTFKKTKARQFLDMALIEMQNNRIHGGEVFNSDHLEEIAHSGEHRYGAGEALVSALIDSQGGYEAFKTIDYASLDRTTPATRAIDAVLRQRGVTETAFRYTICMFPRFFMNRMTRAMPGYCSISFMMSHLIKNAAKAEGDAIAGEYSNDIVQSFANGFVQAAEAVQRISDYQVGMDSADFWVGLRKNMLYDMTLFGANYIVAAAIKRGIIAMLGGWEPPEDEQKITLPWEWRLKLTGLPMKDAWFMDDLLGCGAPLAYAWEILDGYDVKDKDGNVRHVEAYSEEAKTRAWQCYKNMIRTYGPTKDAIDAIEMIADFDEQVEEIMGKDLWTQPFPETVKDFVGGIDKEMSDYYEGTDYNLTIDQMRFEWALGRLVGFSYDLFDELTPKIASQVLPGSRDSIIRDEYQHVTKLEYDLDNYDEKTAKEEYRVKKRPYLEWQAALRTRDNVVEAFFTDWAVKFFNMFGSSDNQSNFSYMEMPIKTSTDPRPRSENNYMNMWSLDQYFDNGNLKPDITGPDGVPDGKEDTREEREKYLFDKAEDLCEYINENYISQDRYPEWAVQNDHFIIPADLRAVAKDYCFYLLGTKNKKGQLEKDIEARKAEVGGRVSAEEWADYQALREKYSTILYDYLNNKDIPWRAPRYAKYESDTAVMYVDSNGNATTWDDPDAHEIKYSYGNRINALSQFSPLVSPVDQGNYDFQPFTWDTLLDDNNQPISKKSMENIYDQAVSSGQIITGIGAGKSAIDVMGANGEIERGEPLVPFDDRGWEVLDTTLPTWYQELDKASIDSRYGIDSYMPDEETNPDDPSSMKTDMSGGSSIYGGNTYSSGNRYGSYSYSGGGGGYYYSYGSGGSNYNPKIYSSSKSVYSQRASGMRTSQPYKATTSYLRPAFYTSGSRTSYRRQE